MRPPSSVYFAALFSRFATTCASRTGIGHDGHGLGRQLDRQLVPRGFDQRPARLDGAAQHRAQVDGLLAQLDPAARHARDLHQVVDEPHEVVDLALEHLVHLHGRRRIAAGQRAGSASRCESAPAGCAARGPASRGTRPCAGPLRAEPARLCAAASYRSSTRRRRACPSGSVMRCSSHSYDSTLSVSARGLMKLRDR